MCEANMDQEDFRAWLQEHQTNEVIGVSCSEKQCPVARWLTARCGVPVEVAGFGGVWFVNEKQPWPAPAWVRQFVQEIDQELPVPCDVLAETALVLLDTLAD